MKNFPEPPKPPLPPPPIPPISSLMNMEKKSKTSKLLINSAQEQLMYSRFLQNYVFKYNNRYMHKTCEPIDMNRLEYLFIENRFIVQNSDLNRLNAINQYINSKISSSSSSPSSLTSTLPPSLHSTVRNSSTGQTSVMIDPSSVSGIRSTTSSAIRTLLGNKNSTILNVNLQLSNTTTTTRAVNRAQHTLATTLKNNFVTKFNGDDQSGDFLEFDNNYFLNMINKFSSNPIQFFFDSLLVPSIFIFVLIAIVLIGLIFKK